MIVFRKAPKSFVARDKALKRAKDRIEQDSPQHVNLNDEKLEQLDHYNETYCPLVEARSLEGKKLLNQLDLKREALADLKKSVSLFIHDFQALVRGGEAHPRERRHYFGLDPARKNMDIPSIEEDVLIFAQELLKAEKRRKMDGKVAVRELWYDRLEDHLAHYEEVLKKAKVLRSIYNDIRNKIFLLLPDLDRFIVKLWNAIDNDLGHLDRSVRREFAAEYGVVYALRSNATEEDTEVVVSDFDGLNETNTQTAADPLILPVVKAELEPEDQDGVEEALLEAGMPLDSPPIANNDEANG